MGQQTAHIWTVSHQSWLQVALATAVPVILLSLLQCYSPAMQPLYNQATLIGTLELQVAQYIIWKRKSRWHRWKAEMYTNKYIYQSI